jgi:diguanylate cyclase (GGDEF)-like protein
MTGFVRDDVGRDRMQAATGGSEAPVEALRAEIGRLSAALTRAERRIAELEARADVDPLLDILNRRGFERELARSLAYVRRYGTRAALIFIDLDRFKAVNDAHGHAAGDALLKQVAATLVAKVRASDTVGRLGGDEFGVIMWHIGEDQAALKARELEAAVEAAGIRHGTASLSVGASAGTLALGVALDVAAAIAAADRAMYARKEERRG